MNGSEIELPSETGTYLLLLNLDQEKEISVGRSGTFSFQPGYYLYLGSAFGPGGLRSRLGRHIRGGEKIFWHIDYLRIKSDLKEVWYQITPEPREHQVAAWLASRPGIRLPVPGFGASDCRCRSHLFYAANLDLIKITRRDFEVGQPGSSTWFFRQPEDVDSTISN